MREHDKEMKWYALKNKLIEIAQRDEILEDHITHIQSLSSILDNSYISNCTYVST
jgi:uncharacterized phage infection (PIP) family protein YhgE